MKTDANDILREHGPEALRHQSDEAWQRGKANGHNPNKTETEHTQHAGIAILSSAEFVRGFVPPNYILDGILQRGFLYSFTGSTGAGKTTIALRLLASTALGRAFAGRDVEPGRCLMLVGENPDDVRMRWIALSEQMGFAADEIDVTFMPGIFSIKDALPRIEARAKQLGGVNLVVVDTSPAYFGGDDENSNSQLGDHARMLRSLTRIPGNPCTVATCHPVKNATQDNLLPRGGGAFLNEVDGNLCCWKSSDVVETHWHGKFRGPDFEPMSFEMLTVTCATLVNSKGKQMPTVIAKPLSDTEQKAKADASDADLYRLLAVMADNEGASIATLAEKAGWKVAGDKPHKSKVSRHLSTLHKQKLADKELNTWRLTPKGEKAASRGAK